MRRSKLTQPGRHHTNQETQDTTQSSGRRYEVSTGTLQKKIRCQHRGWKYVSCYSTGWFKVVFYHRCQNWSVVRVNLDSSNLRHQLSSAQLTRIYLHGLPPFPLHLRFRWQQKSQLFRKLRVGTGVFLSPFAVGTGSEEVGSRPSRKVESASIPSAICARGSRPLAARSFSQWAVLTYTRGFPPLL